MKLRKRTLRFVADKSSDDANANGQRRSKPALRRRASEVMNFRVIKRLILIGVAIGTAFLMMAYSFSLLYNRTGRFSVAIDNPDATFAITLCETPDFNTRSSRLTNDQQVAISNICGDIIPANVDSINGAHNGENYLAYTFYCKNVGSVATAMYYELTFNNVTNHLDEAMRVRLYVDGVYKDYAKARSDGGGKETHYCDESFAGVYLVCADTVARVEVGDYVRFTAVVWLEGDDEDCTDSVINGKIKFDMNIEALPTTEPTP